MSRFLKAGVALVAVLGFTACGGPVEEEPVAEVDSVDQELRSCKPYEPPCPSPYQCVNGICRLPVAD